MSERAVRRAADQNYRSLVAIHPLLTMPFPYDPQNRVLVLRYAFGGGTDLLDMIDDLRFFVGIC